MLRHRLLPSLLCIVEHFVASFQQFRRAHRLPYHSRPWLGLQCSCSASSVSLYQYTSTRPSPVPFSPQRVHLKRRRMSALVARVASRESRETFLIVRESPRGSCSLLPVCTILANFLALPLIFVYLTSVCSIALFPLATLFRLPSLAFWARLTVQRYHSGLFEVLELATWPPPNLSSPFPCPLCRLVRQTVWNLAVSFLPFQT